MIEVNILNIIVFKLDFNVVSVVYMNLWKNFLIIYKKFI